MLVERDVYKELMAGSHEESRVKIAEAIGRHLRNLKESGADVCTSYRLLATFSDKAICVRPDGGVTEFYFKDGGDEVFVESMAPTFKPRTYENESEYLNEKVASAVAELSGGLETASVADIARGIDEDYVGLVIINRLQSLTEGNNLWDKYHSENLAEIISTNWRKASLIDGRNGNVDGFNRLQPRVLGLQRRLSGLPNSELVSSIRVSVESADYWLSKLVSERMSSRKSSDNPLSLVECLRKLDQIITYIESLQAGGISSAALS